MTWHGIDRGAACVSVNDGDSPLIGYLIFESLGERIEGDAAPSRPSQVAAWGSRNPRRVQLDLKILLE